MGCGVHFVGEPLFTQGGTGKPKTRIATVFPRSRVLATRPGIHATQRLDYIEWLDEQRRRRGLPPLSPEQQAAEPDGVVQRDLDFLGV
ncbi:MAG TPA: hypothetical protein EYP56_22195, partial [Planctomycetaceae bacterium]|nr:hypothetical protein [Planctomycetaceae bacterium]